MLFVLNAPPATSDGRADRGYLSLIWWWSKHVSKGENIVKE
jgi:hypothetical protein